MRRFVIGDIHGAYRALKELLKKVKFDLHKDQLIILGDVVDGWSQSKECIDLLLKIKNRIVIRGNHDEWAWKYYTNQPIVSTTTWLMHGGTATIKSLGERELLDKKYIDFFEEAVYYYEEPNRLFAHASVPLAASKFAQIALKDVSSDDLCWTREMVFEASYFKDIELWKWGTRWEEIYVGHTPVQRFSDRVDDYSSPQHWGNIWLMDTGAAFRGSVSIMNIDTKEIWQSTVCELLYPDERGRNVLTWDERQK